MTAETPSNPYEEAKKRYEEGVRAREGDKQISELDRVKALTDFLDEVFGRDVEPNPYAPVTFQTDARTCGVIGLALAHFVAVELHYRGQRTGSLRAIEAAGKNMRDSRRELLTYFGGSSANMGTQILNISARFIEMGG